MAQCEADPDPLNILPELAVTRALLTDYLNRYKEWSDALIAWHRSFQSEEAHPKPARVLDLAAAVGLASEATRIVERIERIRSVNAISRADLNRIMNEMGRVVATYVEPEAAENIREAWLRIRL